jgi:mannose-1-phosphate guanylyltransferase
LEYKSAALKSVKHLKAVILAGGFGTRLRPLSCTRPKILFPIVNKPLLQWTFERLAKNSVNEAILAVNYQTEVSIKQSGTPRCGIHISYSRDPLRKPLGTGGPIRKAEKKIGQNTFLVLNGDIFADVSYSEILKLHEKKAAVATIALYRAEDPSRYGVAALKKNGQIRRFIEKPPPGTAPTNLINAGVYVFSPEIFKYIPEGRAVSLEREVFTQLTEEKNLYGYVFDGLWMDIGKPADYLEINRRLLLSLANPQKRKVAERAQIKEPVALDREVSLGKESVVGPNTILGRNVVIGNGVRVSDSVIFPRVIISDFSTVTSAIIGEDAVIGKKVKIEKGCIIGDHARVKDNASLAQNVYVCPAEEVSGKTASSNRAYREDAAC